MNEPLTPAGLALKEFVENHMMMGYEMNRASVRQLIRSPCGRKVPGDILATITEFSSLGVVTKELGYVSYNDMVVNDQTIYLVRT